MEKMKDGKIYEATNKSLRKGGNLIPSTYYGIKRYLNGPNWGYRRSIIHELYCMDQKLGELVRGIGVD